MLLGFLWHFLSSLRRDVKILVKELISNLKNLTFWMLPMSNFYFIYLSFVVNCLAWKDVLRRRVSANSTCVGLILIFGRWCRSCEKKTWEMLQGELIASRSDLYIMHHI